MFGLRILVEGTWELKKKAFVALIDLRKTLYSILSKGYKNDKETIILVTGS